MNVAREARVSLGRVPVLGCDEAESSYLVVFERIAVDVDDVADVAAVVVVVVVAAAAAAAVAEDDSHNHLADEVVPEQHVGTAVVVVALAGRVDVVGIDAGIDLAAVVGGKGPNELESRAG